MKKNVKREVITSDWELYLERDKGEFFEKVTFEHSFEKY